MAAPSPIQWNAAGALVSVKLNRDNYLLWQSQLESIMDSQDLLQFVDGTQVEPPKEITKDGITEVNPKFVAWRKMDRLALSWIKATVTEAILGQIMRAKTAYDAWSTLEKSYGSQSLLRIMLLRKELLLIKKGKKRLALLKSTSMNSTAFVQPASQSHMVADLFCDQYSVIRLAALDAQSSQEVPVTSSWH
ncbi:hypothetical protein EJ110_NYTH42826 [Nymphaea thermarum]|nr:hypothetical protein EJ110_NYTH42826 [Nymphaea thermarum]